MKSKSIKVDVTISYRRWALLLELEVTKDYEVFLVGIYSDRRADYFAPSQRLQREIENSPEAYSNEALESACSHWQDRADRLRDALFNSLIDQHRDSMRGV